MNFGKVGFFSVFLATVQSRSNAASQTFTIQLDSRKDHTSMFYAWILLLHFLSGGSAFFIHNSHHSLCLEDSGEAGEVLLKKCNLDSDFQQWTWINQDSLMCAATSRCLWAAPGESARTLPCPGQDSAGGFLWVCDRDRLVHRNTSMLLSVNRRHLVLMPYSKQSNWKSLDEGNICQERLRLRRASAADEWEVEEGQAKEEAAMTEEQREFLRWYYRTEDPTTWKFVLLGMAFICLLVGFLLLGMGTMANRSRKKIAKYKAAAALIQRREEVELQGVSSPTGNGTSEEGNHLHTPEWDKRELKAGSILVQWKDGNTSCMYSDQAGGGECDLGKESEPKVMEELEERQSEEEKREEEEEEETTEAQKEVQEQNEATAAEPEPDNGGATKE